MINFETKYPQSRENRLHSGYAYGGCNSDMRKCAGKGCLNNCDRNFGQATFCQMGVSTLISFSTKDSVVIMHGPVGCGSQSHLIDFSIRQYGAGRGVAMSGARWYSTNLTEAEVISGGEKKLKDTILRAESDFRPSAIFILSSCTPAIIGDDIDTVVDELQSQISATLVPLHCPGFKAKVIASAYDVVYHGILQKFKFSPEPYVDFIPFSKDDPDYELKVSQYEYKKSKTVNLYNAWSIGPSDEAEIRRILEALGLNVQIFVEFKHPDEWRNITEAALNVSFCHVHDSYFLEFLKQKFGMPYILPSIPIGIRATGDFVREIARFFGLEEAAERLIESESRELEKALAPIKEKVKGKKVVICGGFLRVGSTSLLAHELGLEVVGLRNFHYDEMGNDLFEIIEKEIGDVSSSISTQPVEFTNILRKLKPDLCICHVGTGTWAAKSGVPSLTLFAMRFAHFGFKGNYEFARRLARAVTNTNFAKNIGRNVALPFVNDWYEKDPYHYIVDNNARD